MTDVNIYLRLTKVSLCTPFIIKGRVGTTDAKQVAMCGHCCYHGFACFLEFWLISPRSRTSQEGYASLTHNFDSRCAQLPMTGGYLRKHWCFTLTHMLVQIRDPSHQASILNCCRVQDNFMRRAQHVCSTMFSN